MNMIQALEKRQVEIMELERIAVQKGINIQNVREKSRTTVFDYKSLLLDAIEGNPKRTENIS